MIRRAYCLCLLTCLSLVPLSPAHHIKQSAAKTMPVTTSSPKARDLFERALTDYENLYLERANIGWRAAVQADPNFAVAYAFHRLQQHAIPRRPTRRGKRRSARPQSLARRTPADSVDHQREGK